MVTRNFELYEALKPTVGTEAARMLVESLPEPDELAKKVDLDRLENKIDSLESKILNRLLTLFVPTWLGIYGVLVALVVALVAGKLG